MSEERNLNDAYDHFIPKVRRDHQSIINEGGTLLTDGIPAPTEQLSTKETISIRRSARSSSPGYLLPRMNSSNMDDDNDGKRLTNRLANLTVSTTAGDEGHRSTTPIPLLPRPSNMTELSPSTLNRLRACGGGSSSIGSNGAGYVNSSANNSTTSSPCVTEVTQIATNTAVATHPNLRLPSFGTGVCNSNRDSPSTSQVSVGSVPPTLTAALLPSMRHHYDLTPVTRNTSGVAVTAGDATTNCSGNSKNDFRHATVTPSDDNNDTDLDDGPFLHGEHLAMPSDFLSSDQEAGGVPILQPALTRILRPCVSGDHAVDSSAAVLESELPVDSRREHRDLPSAIEFPRRKFYSFTSRRQYEENQHDVHNNEHPVLKPYQPDRQENFDIETLPEEELQRIFIARRHSRHSHHHPDTDKDHRLLQTSIPLDEDTRNWSIPSIRMAQQLVGSTTSLTDATDLEDEDSLVYIHPPGYGISSGFDHNILNLGQQHQGFIPTQGATIEVADVHDDLSISSRGSSLCITDMTLRENSHFRHLVNIEGPSTTTDQFLPPHFSIPSDVYSDDTDSIEAVAMGGQEEDNNHSLDLVLNDETLYRHNSPTARSRKRKQQRLKEACEWLQSVEVDQNVVAEAASSKFLTAGNPPDDDEGNFPQQCLHHQLIHPFVPQQIPFQRQISSPANLTAIKSSQTANGTTIPKVHKTVEHIAGL